MTFYPRSQCIQLTFQSISEVQTTVCTYTNSRSSMRYVFLALKARLCFHSEQDLSLAMGTMKSRRENKKSAHISSLCDHLLCTAQCIMRAVTGSQPLIVILLFQDKVSWHSTDSLHWCFQLSLCCSRSGSLTKQVPFLLLALLWGG